MPLRPQTTDYESLIRSRANLAKEDELQARTWPLRPNGNSEKGFVDRSTAPARLSVDRQLDDEGISPVNGSWIRKRGHTLTFAGLFLFSVILYLRPYELFPALSSFKSMAFYTGLVTLILYVITQFTTEGNLTARPREVSLA